MSKLTSFVIICLGLLALAALLQATLTGQEPTGLESESAASPRPEHGEQMLGSLPRADTPTLDARREVPHLADDSTVEVGVAAEADLLVVAAGDLDAHARMALDGAIYINEVLDRMLDFAELPVSDHPDLDYEDDDAISYELVGAPEGTDARVLIGTQSYEEDGTEFRYMQLSVTPGTENPDELIEGVAREAPNVHLSISYAVDEPLKPTRFALLARRPVDIARSRELGIDAYHGRFTNGASYWVDLLKDPDNPTTGTIGIVDARYLSSVKFEGIVPLSGDTTLDEKRLVELLQRLHVHLATIKGE